VNAVTDELREWPDRLERAIALGTPLFREVRVLAETASTQDAIRSIASGPGWVVTTGRQTGGRGRLGRSWADTAHQGVAVTCSVPDAAPERLVLVSAVATHRAIRAVTPEDRLACGIKWPNDIVTRRGKKLAGILIERVELAEGPCALVGIGVNVLQESFPPELADRATSLALEGAIVRRIDLLESLLREWGLAWQEPLASVLGYAAEYDALRGAMVGCATPDGTIDATVVRADPMRGLIVRLPGDSEERLLPAATTSILSWKPREV
jgi:BirA family biotin operon repressor/biotin-[acetyl-CoA-carboxylase] ligase